MTTETVLFALLRAAVCGETLNNGIKEACTPEMLRSVYCLSSQHDLAHLAGYALEKLGLPDSQELEKFREATQKAIYRYVRLDHECGRIRTTLEEARIPYMPLKGAVLRQYYPEPWMRTSCDVDVLVREETLDRAVEALERQGWAVKGKKNFHDISLYAPSGIHLELHFNIKECMENLDPTLEKVWDHGAPVAGERYEYRQTNEFLLFHLLAHMAYHFVSGGCGVRTFLDIWLLKQQLSLDEKELQELCNAAELETFRGNVWALTDVWFGGKAHTAMTAQMEAFVLNGGVHGSLPNRVMMDQAKIGGKTKNFINRVFMPYDSLKINYPVLEKHKWLTPLFQVVRWIRTLFNGRMKRSLRELRLNQSQSQEQVRAGEKFLRDVGLKFPAN